MADSSPVDPLRGRTVVLAGEAGTLREQAEASLVALGASVVRVQLDGTAGLEAADLKEEARVGAALNRVAATVGDADALLFVGRDLRSGEAMASFIEESIASYHFHLKLAKRLRAKAAMDVLALARTSSELAAAGQEAALAADIRNGALRQMTLVAASEGGPLKPPLLANAVLASGPPRNEPSESLTNLLARLLARPQGYVTGTSLTITL